MRIKASPIDTYPTDIKLHQTSGVLDITFHDGKAFQLPCEYLRVYTPSAEALGHAPGQEILQVGKENVRIDSLKPVGNYGIAPQFSDGHNSGIYTWDLLYKLGNEYAQLWAAYLDELTQAGHTRPASPLN